MQFNNHVDTQPVKRFESAMRYIYDIKFGMLQVRKNEISLRKCSGGSADRAVVHLRGNTSYQGVCAMITVAVTLDNSGSDPKSQDTLHKFPEEN